MEKSIFIASINKLFPPQYSHQYMANQMYKRNANSPELDSAAQTAVRLAQKIGIRQRSTVLNLEKLPIIELLSQKDSPENWGQELIESLCLNFDKEKIGHLSVSYNIAATKDTLPNLGSQMAQLGLINPEWIDHKMGYGCAAGILSADDSINYCTHSNRASIAIAFDQCSWAVILAKLHDSDFRRSMISNLLFADAGVGMLFLPPELAEDADQPLLKITGMHKVFIPGSLIYMRDGKFLMNDIKSEIPALVASKIIKPLLQKHHLKQEDIDEWCIHQGGPEILKKFMDKDILGLSAEQLSRSMELFYEYGNLSSPSCLFVLESFFNEKTRGTKKGKKGMVVGFGAGYYLAAFLYEWV